MSFDGRAFRAVSVNFQSFHCRNVGHPGFVGGAVLATVGLPNCVVVGYQNCVVVY